MRRYVATTGAERRQVEMYQIWFRTRGCTYDRAGQCSMCNYGIGPEIDPGRIARALRRRLATVPEGASIYLSPSGSLLDDVEVVPELRDELLQIVAARRPALFAFESRPELFTAEKLDHIRRTITSAALIGQVGAESWDPQIRNLCHLKPTPQQAYLSVARLLAEHGFASVANITLGGLGLSPAEAYRDALDGIRGTRAAGYTTQMVFPLSAKAWTLLGWAADRGLWQPPSLWMLVKLLAEGFDARSEARGDLSISWFDPELNDVVRERPDGCPLCRPVLVEALNEFRADSRTPVALESALAWRGCECLAGVERRLLPPAESDPGYLSRLSEISDRWRAEHPGTGLPLLPRA